MLASGELGKGRVIGGCVGSVRLLVAVAELRLDGVRAREDPQSLASTHVFFCAGVSSCALGSSNDACHHPLRGATS